MAKDIDELLKKKTVKDSNAPKEKTDMKTRMQNVVNASKRLAENNEEQKDRNEDLKLRLSRAMEATSKMEAEYADEFAEEEKAKKKAEAQKEARRKKLEEQQKKALEKLAAIEQEEKGEKKSKKSTTTPKKAVSPKKAEPVIKEVIKEVKVEVPVEKIVEKEVVKEVVKEVPVEVIKEVKVEVPVEKIVEKEVVKEVIKEVPVEVIKEVKVEVPVEVVKTVPVEVIKEIKVEVPVEKEVIKEVVKEVPVEVIKEVKVEVPVTKEVIKEVPVEKELVKEVIKEVKVEVPVEKEVIKEVPVIKEVVKEVPVDRVIKQEVIKEVRVEVPVIKEVKVEVPVEKIIEKEVIKEVVKEVPVEVESKKVEETKAEPVKKEKPVLNFFIKTMNGMALGLFATLIIGTILDTIATIPFIKNAQLVYDFITNLAKVLKFSMGIGIGVGVAINMGFKDLKLICVGLAGAVASYMCGKSLEFFNVANLGFKVGDPLTVYVTVVLTGLLIKLLFKKKTSIDIIIIPLIVSVVAGLISFSLSPAVIYVTTAIGNFIEAATQLHPLIMGMIIAVIMGMALTAPISSAAIAAVVLVDAPLAGGAAAIGCCVQMIGFAVQTARDNKVGSVISVAIGTSMLQFKNILKKPVVWLPTIVVSAILGPIATCVLGTNCLGVNAGMGSSGLVGIIGTYSAMSTAGVDKLNILLSIVGLEIVAPIILVFIVDMIFRKIGWIKKGDLEL